MAEAARQSGGGGRLVTRVPGLDDVLAGGLLRGTTILLAGPPGSGKTVLASQLAFSHVGTDGHAIYVTLLSEPQGQLLEHLAGLAFFDPAGVGDGLYFVNGYGELEEGGTDALLALLRRLIRNHRADLLVLDGLPVIQTLTASGAAFQRFLHEVHALATITGCTVVALAAVEEGEPAPGAAQFDALVVLHDEAQGLTAERSLHVAKLRGSGYLRGRHVFRIDEGGLRVFPRLESQVHRPAPATIRGEGRTALGVPGLDDLLGGGIVRATSLLAVGRAGTGKSSLAGCFLREGARRGEPGLYLAVGEEAPEVLRPLGEGVEVMIEPPVEVQLDGLGARILEAVARTGARRLVLDGVGALALAIPRRERVEPFLAALCSRLRGQGLTTLMTLESEAADAFLRATAGLFQNLFELHLVDSDRGLRRVLAIIETAAGPSPGVLRELVLEEGGALRLGEALHAIDGLHYARVAAEDRR